MVIYCGAGHGLMFCKGDGDTGQIPWAGDTVTPEAVDLLRHVRLAVKLSLNCLTFKKTWYFIMDTDNLMF